MKRVVLLVIAAVVLITAAAGTRAQIAIDADSALLWKTLPYQYGVTGEILNAVYSPDETKIIVTTTEKWCELDAETGAFIRMLPDSIRGLKMFTEGGKYFLSYYMQKVSYPDMKVVGRFLTPPDLTENGEVSISDFEVNEEANVVIGYIRRALQQPLPKISIVSYDYTTYQEIKRNGLEGHYMKDLKISPTGEYLLTQTYYNPDLSTENENRWVCTQWDLNTLEPIKELPQIIDNQLILLGFSDNGERIGAIRNEEFSIYDGKSFELINNYIQKSEMRVGLDFSSDGKNILAGPFWDDKIETLSLQFSEVDNKKIIYKYEGDWSNIAGTVALNLNKDSKKILFIQSSKVQMIKIPTLSVFSISKEEKISLDPNPTKGIAILKLENYSERRIIIEILDTTGKVLSKEQKYLGSAKEIPIDLSEYANGSYQIMCKDASTGRVFTTHTLIKE